MSDADILVRSYSRDFQWLEYCLAAIRRWCSGFREVVLVVPERSSSRARRWSLQYDRMEVCLDRADDYLGQQITKLHADQFTDAALIAHIDSDCVVREPLCPENLCDELGRPRLAITPNSYFVNGGSWRAGTERFLGWPVEFDYMRRQPLLYPCWLYGELRRHSVERHGVSLEEYVGAQPPMGFSEFNVLGAFAHRRHPDALALERHPSADYDETNARMFWSWEGITPAARRELVALAGEVPDA